jgi:hypothetical protein
MGFLIKSGISEYKIRQEISDLDIEILGIIKSTRLAYDSMIEQIRAFQMKGAMESMRRLWGLTD